MITGVGRLYPAIQHEWEATGVQQQGWALTLAELAGRTVSVMHHRRGSRARASGPLKQVRAEGHADSLGLLRLLPATVAQDTPRVAKVFPDERVLCTTIHRNFKESHPPANARFELLSAGLFHLTTANNRVIFTTLEWRPGLRSRVRQREPCVGATPVWCDRDTSSTGATWSPRVRQNYRAVIQRKGGGVREVLAPVRIAQVCAGRRVATRNLRVRPECCTVRPELRPRPIG